MSTAPNAPPNAAGAMGDRTGSWRLAIYGM